MRRAKPEPDINERDSEKDEDVRDEEPGAIAQEVADCVHNDHGRRQILKVAPGAARLERKAFLGRNRTAMFMANFKLQRLLNKQLCQNAGKLRAAKTRFEPS